MFWGDISCSSRHQQESVTRSLDITGSTQHQQDSSTRSPDITGSTQHQQDSSTRSPDITGFPRHQQDSSTRSPDITGFPRHQQDSSTGSLDNTESPINQQDPLTRFLVTPEPSGNNHCPIPHNWQRRPFTERKTLPRTPLNRPPPSKPITTPSAAKNFSRAKNKMIAELFQLFNESVFDRLVSQMPNFAFNFQGWLSTNQWPAMFLPM